MGTTSSRSLGIKKRPARTYLQRNYNLRACGTQLAPTHVIMRCWHPAGTSRVRTQERESISLARGSPATSQAQINCGLPGERQT